MPTSTWNPQSETQFVDWNTQADWLPQGVPDSVTTDVVVPEITQAGGGAYNFDITIASGQSYSVASLSITDNDLIIDGSLVVAGTLTLGAGAEIDLSGSLSLGGLSNLGIDIQGSGRISGAGAIDNQGLIIGGPLTLDFGGFRNDGTLIAGEGSLELDVGPAPGAFANLAGGTLSLGTIEALDGGVLDLNAGAAITTDAATIIFQETSGFFIPPTIETTAGGVTTSLTQTLGSIATGGVLSLQATSFAGAVPLSDAGQITLDSGTLSSPGLTVLASGTVSGNGTISAPITNDGAIVAANYGTLALGGPVGGGGAITIMPTSVLDISGADTNAVSFGDWNGTLVLRSPTSFAGAISGFTAGLDTLYFEALTITPTSDTILLPGLSASAVTDLAYTGNSAAGTLSFQDAGSAVALNFVGDYTASDFVIAAGPQALSSLPPSVQITEVPPCFAAGTRLLTDQGEVAVECLRLGDRVRTMIGGGTAAIRWIGYRRVESARHARPENIWPIRVRAHAFRPGRPRRDLLLSPDHAIYLEGVLIPARYLVNGASVAQMPLATVTYYHIELPSHDVVLAEGLPTESFLDTGNRAAFANGGVVAQCHPEFARRVWDADGCAELVVRGPALERARARLERSRATAAARVLRGARAG